MQGSECRLIHYMEGSSKRFVIPVYQRNYDWKIENCKQLYDDLVKIITNNRVTHFFGSVVSVYALTRRNTEFLIIDGQQRLTTVSLLLLAMHDLMEKGIVVPEDSGLAEKILEDYLIDKHQSQETRIKLKPVKNDQNAYQRLYDCQDDCIRESNLTINYKYFYDRIQKEEITIDELFDAICSLEIIDIKLGEGDNPQLIFESLNSTGLDLSEGDKIRNYILMGLPAQKQEEYYDKYWNRIEECTQYDVSPFMRDYLSIKQGAIPSQKEIYIAFKRFVEQNSFDADELLQELLAYAKRYEILLNGGTNNKELNACIFRLNRLVTTVTRPFFLEVFRMRDEGKLDIGKVANIFIDTESYLFRRSMCDLPTNALNKIFLNLHREIIRYDGTDDNYVEKFRYALLSKKEKAKFPDDEEFVNHFSEKQVYLMNRKNTIYMLERFENYGTLEDKDVYRHCDEGDYSVEHIMPQHLSNLWVSSLGDDSEQIHDTWVHRIANLTLTAYNSNYSNLTFEQKKTMQNGYSDSGIRMNAYIAQKDKWTLTELEDRNQYLMQRALDIWKYPATDFKPAAKQMESYSLADDTENMRGRAIVKFSYKNMEQPASSWAEMLQKVLQILYSEDKSIITSLASRNSEGIAVYFGYDASAFTNSAEIGDGIYVLTNSSTQQKLYLLSQVFELYNLDTSDLVFYLRDENTGNDDEAGTRYETRRKYWTYALDIIKKEHGDNGSFQNVNPTKANWINGYFGIGGIEIVCVANMDCARVEICIMKSIKEENKKIFDRLINHKEAIENSMGIPLIWDRGEDKKSAKIYCQLQEVSIEHEVDWPQMAKFHAEWSKKFLEIFTPYLGI